MKETELINKEFEVYSFKEKNKFIYFSSSVKIASIISKKEHEAKKIKIIKG